MIVSPLVELKTMHSPERLGQCLARRSWRGLQIGSVAGSIRAAQRLVERRAASCASARTKVRALSTDMTGALFCWWSNGYPRNSRSSDCILHQPGGLRSLGKLPNKRRRRSPALGNRDRMRNGRVPPLHDSHAGNFGCDLKKFQMVSCCCICFSRLHHFCQIGNDGRSPQELC